MRYDFFDYTVYGIHPTLAVLVSLVWSAAAALSLALGSPAALAVSPLLIACLLMSDFFAVVALEQLGYLWRHSLCPWYMVAEFYPADSYFHELFGYFVLACAGPDTFGASLDLAACLARPLRALVAATLVNGAFADLCYKVVMGVRVITAAGLRGLRGLTRWLWSALRSAVRRLLGM